MKEVKQENRLSRWSRRKQQTAQETQKEDLALQLQEQKRSEADLPETAVEEGAEDVESQDPVLTDVDMPAIESLKEDSNFGQFMSPGVSDELRNLALRKMYQAPFFNIRDGLDEYDEDFTTFEKLGDIITADMRHQMEIEARKKLEQEAEEIARAASNSDAEADDASIDDQQTLMAEADDEDVEAITVEPGDQPLENKIENSTESRVQNQ